MKLGAELGRGALGRVVRVTREGEPDLAGKILHRSHRADPRAVARLEAEARLVGELRHPNLVGMHGLAEIEGEQVLLMDLVAGPPLATLIAREAPLPAERAAELARGIAAGLAAAHRAGLVHRDLKPANVLLGADGAPRIVDFGLARATALTGVAAGDLVVVGTPAYMAPEAVDPMAIDARSDLYALGCIVFEMLTGRPPFDGATTVAVLEQHRGAPRPELPGVPDDLARLVRWLLAPSPADRPQSAAVVERALAERTALVHVGPGAAPRAACVACGAALIREVPVCFACRAPQLVVGDGDHTVFVVGPGRLTHKLDSHLRQRLLEWLRASPGTGLAPGKLEQEVPRVPFVLIAGVDPDSAEALCAALRGLGLEVEARRGGRFGLPAIKQKARTMGGRYASVTLVGMAGGFHALGLFTIPAFAVAGGIAVFTGYYSSARPVCVRVAEVKTDLPPALAAAIGRVGPVVAAVEEARHRDALRGVVERALALHASVPADEAKRIAVDLARVVDLATVAASKLDELEHGVDAASLHGGDPAVRQRLRDRDIWAARLLEVTALLDGLRARWAMARTAAATGGELDELRVHLEALEELRRAT
jgi:hypothetical protein